MLSGVQIRLRLLLCRREKGRESERRGSGYPLCRLELWAAEVPFLRGELLPSAFLLLPPSVKEPLFWDRERLPRPARDLVLLLSSEHASFPQKMGWHPSLAHHPGGGSIPGAGGCAAACKARHASALRPSGHPLDQPGARPSVRSGKSLPNAGGDALRIESGGFPCLSVAAHPASPSPACVILATIAVHCANRLQCRI